MVYLIVSPKNPLKDGISSDSGRERYMAAVEAATVEDVVACANSLELHTTYFLKGGSQ